MATTLSLIERRTGQPSFLAYFNLDTRRDAPAILGATGGVYFAGGTLGPLILPAISDRYGRRWGIAIVRRSSTQENATHKL